jgi:predicted enzyme related to lactoylglutathione lyase
MTTPDESTIPKLIATTIDCADLETMTRFWAELLGVDHAIHDHFGFLAHAGDRKVTLWLQKVDDERVGKNRLHLDFVVQDLAATLGRVTALGGGVGDQHEWRGFVWRTCTDPEGNVFDIMQAQTPDDDSND